MEDYSFIDEILQIRGVTSVREEPFDEGRHKPGIAIHFDMGSQDDGDLEKLDGILKNQKSVYYSVHYIKSDTINL